MYKNTGITAFNAVNTDENTLMSIPVPENTKSYVAVSNRYIIETIHEKLSQKNISIANKWYKTNRNKTKMIGRYDLSTNNDTMYYSIGFKNSYDKSMSVGFISGASIIICNNGCFSGEIKYVKRHIGSINDEIIKYIDNIIDNMGNVFEKLLSDINILKQKKIDKKATYELIGRMYLEKNLCTATQLSLIKHELTYPTYEEFKEPNMWSIYNIFTNVYKTSHVSFYYEKHNKLHSFMMEESVK